MSQKRRPVMVSGISEGETLFASGDLEQAEQCFLEVLEQNPGHSDALNNLGVIYQARGNPLKAEDCFSKALAFQENNLDALMNLADLCQDAERWPETAEHLEKAIAFDGRNTELFNRLGMAYLEMGRIDKAGRILEKSLNLDPGQEIVRESLDRIRSDVVAVPEEKIPAQTRPASSGVDITSDLSPGLDASRIVFPCKETRGHRLLFLELPNTNMGAFLDPIVDHFKKGYEVKLARTDRKDEVADLIDWADTVWLEWANQMAVHVTNEIPQIKDKKVICRLHGYEVFTDFPAQINWEVVDHLIFVARHKQEIFNQRFKVPSPPQTVVRNGINLETFSIAPNKKNTKHLVMIGHLNSRKGLPMLLQFYHELLKRDPEFRLSIRGDFQDDRLEMACRTMIKELGLESRIEFVGWVDDLDRWLADKSHVLSFSLEESFHYTVGNGMAAGMKPVIHAWRESREIWPEPFIFRNLDEFLSIILDSEFTPRRYREMLSQRGLTVDSQLGRISRIIESVVHNREPAKDDFSPRPSGGSDAARHNDFTERWNPTEISNSFETGRGTPRSTQY